MLNKILKKIQTYLQNFSIIKTIKFHKLKRYSNLYKKNPYFMAELREQEAHNYIYNRLIESYQNKKGLCISRIGFVEASYIFNAVDLKFRLIKNFDYISNAEGLRFNAGFFSDNVDDYKKFVEESIKLMKNIDILGQFHDKEIFFKPLFKNAKIVQLTDLEPFRVQDPWIKYIEGKKVLVIHPFKNSIEYQLQRKDLWLKNKKWLPDCDIKIIQAVQSIAGNKPNQFDSWFDALEYMKNEVKKVDFDIALIGCGAYGPFLGDFIKNFGKLSVVMGGATQLLFGIIGSRWENLDFFKNNVINEYWIRPLDSDKPKNFNSVEGGCYW